MIPETCAKIAYSIASVKRDALHDTENSESRKIKVKTEKSGRLHTSRNRMYGSSVLCVFIYMKIKKGDNRGGKKSH